MLKTYKNESTLHKLKLKWINFHRMNAGTNGKASSASSNKSKIIENIRVQSFVSFDKLRNWVEINCFWVTSSVISYNSNYSWRNIYAGQAWTTNNLIRIFIQTWIGSFIILMARGWGCWMKVMKQTADLSFLAMSLVVLFSHKKKNFDTNNYVLTN